jgi:hypothetical protein
MRDLHNAEMAEIEKLLTEAQKARLRELKLGESAKAKEPDAKHDTDKKAESGKKDDTSK